MEISNDTLMLIAFVNIALTMGSAAFGMFTNNEDSHCLRKEEENGNKI